MRPALCMALGGADDPRQSIAPQVHGSAHFRQIGVLIVNARHTLLAVTDAKLCYLIVDPHGRQPRAHRAPEIVVRPMRYSLPKPSIELRLVPAECVKAPVARSGEDVYRTEPRT